MGLGLSWSGAAINNPQTGVGGCCSPIFHFPLFAPSLPVGAVMGSGLSCCMNTALIMLNGADIKLCTIYIFVFCSRFFSFFLKNLLYCIQGDREIGPTEGEIAWNIPLCPNKGSGCGD